MRNVFELKNEIKLGDDVKNIAITEKVGILYRTIVVIDNDMETYSDNGHFVQFADEHGVRFGKYYVVSFKKFPGYTALITRVRRSDVGKLILVAKELEEYMIDNGHPDYIKDCSAIFNYMREDKFDTTQIQHCRITRLKRPIMIAVRYETYNMGMYGKAGIFTQRCVIVDSKDQHFSDIMHKHGIRPLRYVIRTAVPEYKWPDYCMVYLTVMKRDMSKLEKATEELKNKLLLIGYDSYFDDCVGIWTDHCSV